MPIKKYYKKQKETLENTPLTHNSDSDDFFGIALKGTTDLENKKALLKQQKNQT